ncbi:nucleoside deaminase [Candidatus Thiodiazotropha endoloripes]|nr:nucleoside deaminase [Candidatus Thiodiazotropha endoloripes]MCW4181966.1 nucleoside deaminase [Candidatus Thiodiazotropha weberae]MCW4190819.1 nucleoside deaminase [Candidatus Thiodiazotropha weberae]
MDQDQRFMEQALEQAQQGLALGHGGPFGAVIVVENQIIGAGWNQVVHLNDPTAHAEMQAIRKACQHQQNFNLAGAVLYTTCEPCPMCLSAAYWARIERLVYAATGEDAAVSGFDDSLIAAEMCKPSGERLMPSRQIMRDASLQLFKAWQSSDQRIDY